MSKTAQQISSGNNLTRRIQLPSGPDEVHGLALALDQMMARRRASCAPAKPLTTYASH